MEITAAQIKELRDKTGAGMMDCKKALQATAGNMDEAILHLREQGLAQAAKRSGRTAAEGLIFATIAADGSAGVMVEVNAETDFVAKNEAFKTFVRQVGEQLLSSGETSLDSFLQEKASFDEGSISDALVQKIAVIGEHMAISRIIRMEQTENSKIYMYIHGEGQTGSMIKLKSDTVSDLVDEAGHNICLQIAAMLPQYLRAADIPADLVTAEKDIIVSQFENEGTLHGKPEQVQVKIVEGAVNKWANGISLLGQDYVKDASVNIEKYLQAVSKENGSPVEILEFACFELGGTATEEKAQD